MQRLLFFICFLLGLSVVAQNEQLAFNYYEKGEYEKAQMLLEPLLKQNPYQYLYFEKLISCYQQLKKYNEALNLITTTFKQRPHPRFLIEEGYIYQLQENKPLAEKKYDEALKYIEDNPNYAYVLGSTFEKKVLLEWSLKSYELGAERNPELNFDYQIALISGQMGNLEKMIYKLLDYAYINPNNTQMVQNYLSRFFTETATESFKNDVKKALIVKLQKQPDIFWNQFLSWFYVQQKEFGKAFVQEKAVFKRNQESLNTIVYLGEMALEYQQIEDAKMIFEYVLENTLDDSVLIKVHYQLLQLKISQAQPEDFQALNDEIHQLIEQFSNHYLALDLKLLEAHFLCFKLSKPDEAIQKLKKILSKPLSERDEAKVKLLLGDIGVYNEHFNQAILNFAQVEDKMKNDPLGHEASLKMAKANYYKQDFDWSLQQVKVLKQSASLLIANDALELFLLIQDNILGDSLKVALKEFSKADLLLYQNKKQVALTQFKTVLSKFSDDAIVDDALIRIGRLEEDFKQFENAVSRYHEIVEKHEESVYVDEALFYRAEIYRKHFNNIEKAKELYEALIFNHPDSIFFTEARRQYRILRGDTSI